MIEQSKMHERLHDMTLNGMLLDVCVLPKKNKGLHRAMHNTTAACQQGKVEQVYIKSKTANCWTQ